MGTPTKILLGLLLTLSWGAFGETEATGEDVETPTNQSAVTEIPDDETEASYPSLPKTHSQAPAKIPLSKINN